MKKTCLFLILFSTITSTMHSEEQGDGGRYVPGGNYSARYGNISADATTTAIGVSMLGWGIGIAAVVATLAILIPPDEANNNHSHCE